MKIVYCASKGCYLAVVAAALHLNSSFEQEFSDWSSFKKLKYFDQTSAIELGKLILIGTDKFNNQIYILGSGRVAQVIEHATLDLIKIFKIESDILFVDLTSEEDYLLKLGLRIKSYMFNSKLANYLIQRSLISSMPQLVEKVLKIKKKVQTLESNL